MSNRKVSRNDVALEYAEGISIVWLYARKIFYDILMLVATVGLIWSILNFAKNISFYNFVILGIILICSNILLEKYEHDYKREHDEEEFDDLFDD